MGPPKWSKEITSKFISLYKQQECLWNNDNELYRDKEARDNALLEIIAGMGIEGLGLNDVKTKIKHLRSTYMIEVHKVEKAKRSGFYRKPSLSWFDQMNSFIKSAPVENFQSVMVESNYQTSENSKAEANEETSTQATRIINTTNIDSKRLNYSYKQPTGLKRSRLPKTVSKRLKFNSKLDENEFDIFGKYVAVQLKTLLDKDAILAQNEIQRIITRFKLKKWARENRQGNNRKPRRVNDRVTTVGELVVLNEPNGDEEISEEDSEINDDKSSDESSPTSHKPIKEELKDMDNASTSS